MFLTILLFFSFSHHWQTFYNSELIEDYTFVDDTVFLATNGGILKAIYTDSLYIVYRYTNLDGLSEPVINGLVADNWRNLWAIGDQKLFFKPKDEDLFYTYDNITVTDSLTSISYSRGIIFISFIHGILKINLANTPANFLDDSIIFWDRNNLPVTSDSILGLKIYADTLYFWTPNELCYGYVEDFPEILHRIPVDSLPFSPGNQLRIIDLYKNERNFAIVTNYFVLFRDINGNWEKIHHVDYNGVHYDMGRFMTISGKGHFMYLGFGKLEVNGTLLHKLPLVSIDTLGRTTLLSPDTVLCGELLYVVKIIPFDSTRIMAATVCPQIGNQFSTQRKCGGVTWILDNSRWYAKHLGLLVHNYISGISKSGDGKIWFFTSFPSIPNYSSRLFRLNGDSFIPVGNFHHVFSDSTGELDLITDICTDKKGNLWVCTNHNGIFMIKNDSIVTHLYPHTFIPTVGFTADNKLIYNLYPVGIFVHIGDSDLKISSLTQAYVINNDREGNIWIGDVNDGFEVYTKDYNLLISSNSYNLPSRSVHSIKHFGDYHFIGTNGGLFIIKGTSPFKTILNGVKIRSMDIDPHGFLWVLSEYGVYVIDIMSLNIIAYYSEVNSGLVGNTNEVGPNYFYYKLIRNDILVDPENHCVWIGSTHGLSKLTTDLYWNFSDIKIKPKISPNPVRDSEKWITIDGINDEIRDFFIFNIAGKRMETKSAIIDNAVKSIKIDVANFPPGTYFLLINGNIKLKFSVIR